MIDLMNAAVPSLSYKCWPHPESLSKLQNLLVLLSYVYQLSLARTKLPTYNNPVLLNLPLV